MLDLSHGGYQMVLLAGPVDTINKRTFTVEEDWELDAFVGYTVPVGDAAALRVGFNTFTFFRNPSNNFLEFAGKLSYGDMALNLSYTNKISLFETSLAYVQGVFNPRLTDNIMLTSSLGYVHFAKPEAIGNTDYLDYKVGVATIYEGWYAELFYTNTLLRRDVVTGDLYNKDNALTFMVAKSFTVF
jgi:uncharacterized protein (TIGR02001 family)